MNLRYLLTDQMKYDGETRTCKADGHVRDGVELLGEGVGGRWDFMVV